jgi:serine/threonine protein kinase/TPR repeat protein
MEAGDVLAGRFVVEQLAGQGGMGAVYRALDQQDGRRVAVKLLREDTGDARRFAREIDALAQVQHPGVVRYIAHGQLATGAPYLAMEWLVGEDLAQRLARQRLSVKDALAVVSRASEAVAAAHARGVIHRDIKPANIFLVGGSTDQVKVLDFGLAKLCGGGSRLTATGAIMGTLGYMAPEQLRGERDLDERVDVFALGCVLFECLAGQPPFAGSTPIAVLAKVLLEEPPRIQTLCPGVPIPLDDLVASLTAKSRERRPADAAQVATQISALPSCEEVPVEQPPAAHKAISAAEQLLFSVVLVAPLPAEPADSDGPTAVAPSCAELVSLRSVASQSGGRLDALVDGSLVVSHSGRATASDLAHQAARCALELQRCLPGRPIALATGRALALGRSLAGDVIDRAARMLGADGFSDAEIRLDEVTASLAESAFIVERSAGGLRLVGVRQEPSGARFSFGRASPFVGRERELTTLGALYDECAGEHVARAIVVVAPAGMGKSRLQREFSQRLSMTAEAPQIWLARADAVSAGAPLHPLAGLIRSLAGVQHGEPAERSQTKLRERITQQLPADRRERVTVFLGEMVGVPFPEREFSQLRGAREDRQRMADQVRQAWEDFVEAECSTRPLVLILEDLHWGDGSTVQFIDAALKRHRDRPLMVLALGRPDVLETFPRIWEERRAVVLPLDRLSPRMAERLAREMLDAAASGETTRMIVDRAEGNPFFIEEFVRAAAEGRVDALPDTVLAMVQARLERLEPEARRVLRAASVFGETFWSSGVDELVSDGSDRFRVEEWLQVLVQREIVHPRGRSRFAGEREFTFQHALVREAALAMFTGADLTLGHRLTGAWLERKGEPDALMIAEHFHAGGEKQRAVPWFRRAADQALRSGDLQGALKRADKGIECGAQGDDLAAFWQVKAEAQFFGAVTPPEVCARLAGEALNASRPGTPTWYAAVHVLALALPRSGGIEELVRLSSTLRDVTGAHPLCEEQVTAAGYVVAMLQNVGMTGEAEAWRQWLEGEASAAVADAPMAGSLLAQSKSVWAIANGELMVGLEEAERARSLAEAAGDLRMAAIEAMTLGTAHAYLGEFHRAAPLYEAAGASADRMGAYELAELSRMGLAEVLTYMDQVDEGERLALSLLSSCESRGPWVEAMIRVLITKVHLQRGRTEAAAREAAATLALRDSLPPPLLCQALAVLAQVRLAQGSSVDALASAREARQLLDVLGNLDDGEAYVRLAFAEALLANNDDAACAEVIAVRDWLLTRAAKLPAGKIRQRFLDAWPPHRRIMALASN